GVKPSSQRLISLVEEVGEFNVQAVKGGIDKRNARGITLARSPIAGNEHSYAAFILQPLGNALVSNADLDVVFGLGHTAFDIRESIHDALAQVTAEFKLIEKLCNGGTFYRTKRQVSRTDF